ncbi:hypothetical protein ACQ86N_14885 [Puia sp. P3]|uniref:hypothetical protein n=1 Tax=Puia sp. P3 TaxID=3423952 RepID=UPI003D66C434
MKRILTVPVVLFVLILFSCKKDHHNPPSGNATPDLQQVADGLVSPVALAEPADGTKRLFVVDQTGKIWIIQADGTKSASPLSTFPAKWSLT